MLNFITGTPGAGKTQFVIDYVLHTEGLQGREVYYWGIPDVDPSLGWHRIGNDTFDMEAAKSWHELVPDGAVVIMDEAHQVWPKLKQGATPPPHFAPLGTTRHRGLTIFAITQYPTHVGTEYRGRTERHYHLERKRGWERAVLFEWDKYAYPLDKDERRQALSKKFYKYNPEIWKLYKSATVHNVERKKLPKKVWLVPIAIVVAIAAVAGATMNLRSMDDRNNTGADGPTIFGAGTAQDSTGAPAPTLTAYLDIRSPRIPRQDWTAPMYDEARKVVSYPRPQCIMTTSDDGEVRCWCYTQQASRLDVSQEFCLGVVQLGYFDPAVPDQYLDAEEQPYIPPVAERRQGPTFHIAPYSGHDTRPTVDYQAAQDRVDALRDRL